MSELAASPATLGRAPMPPAISIRRLPEPPYGDHPAYGQAFGSPSLATRAKAIRTLLPWMGLVAIKRALNFDRLPVLPDYDGPMAGGIGRRIAALPRYAPLIARGFAKNVVRALSRQDQTGGGPRLQAIRRDGAVAVTFADGDMAAIRKELSEPLAALYKKRDALRKRTFEGNQSWLNRKEAPGLYALLDDVLTRNGVYADASSYLGRPVTMTHLTVQVNDAKDGFHHNKFADIGIPDPATNYMHVDTTDEILKFMIYLNEVRDTTGPFAYVMGSARLQIGWFEGIVRRAVDRSGLSGYSVPTRELFMALPKPLRRKCTFGSDLIDGSPEAEALIAAEHRFTSADGDAILFDNLGIHRGALVTEGERQMMVVTLA
jgi:hypothetical protein